MNQLIAYLRVQNALSKSPREVMFLVANYSLAREIIITPHAVRDALTKVLPEHGATLFEALGVRQNYSLAVLCHLALYDDWLMYAMSLILEALLDP